jgi:hypothetical protein
MAKTPLGRLEARAFGALELPRLERTVLEGFRALSDLTGTTSDALDECRISGVVPRVHPEADRSGGAHRRAGFDGFESAARRGHDAQIRSGRSRGA